MAPKQKRPKPAVRRRQWQMLRGILNGKNLKQIDNELGRGLTYYYAAAVSGRLKQGNAQRLRALIRENSAKKFKRQKAGEIIELMTKVILGKAELPRGPQKPAKPIMPKVHPKKAAEILADLRRTKKTLAEIAAARGIGQQRVSNAYHRLLDAGEGIPERIRGGSQRDMSRRTGVIGRGEIPGILAKKEAQIAKKAGSIFMRYRWIFQAAGVLPEDIAQHIRGSLVWKLETFDPTKMKKAPPKEKLDRYISFHITRLALDKLKIAARKARRKAVMLQRFPTKEPGRREGEIARLADIPERTMPPEQDPQETIDLLGGISRKAGLLRQEKAVLFAKAAGLKGKRLAAMVGISESGVALIFTSARKKMAKAGIAHGTAWLRGG